MTTQAIRLFEVGGSIRDELMGITDIPDRDFCAVAPSWSALLEWCHANMEKVFQVKPEFLTIRGRMSNGDAIDVVMCRKDGSSSDGRHPDEVEPGTLLDDLARRDFTINAMAREVNPLTLEPIGDIIDPFGGEDHLRLRQLHCVGNTDERFEEDGLRVLRALRFIITKDLAPCFVLNEELSNGDWWIFAGETVSNERIREEFTKMFKHCSIRSMSLLAGGMPAEAMLLLSTAGIWLKPTTENK